MDYLHTNGSFLVVKTYMDNLAQIGICTFTFNKMYKYNLYLLKEQIPLM